MWEKGTYVKNAKVLAKVNNAAICMTMLSFH